MLGHDPAVSELLKWHIVASIRACVLPEVREGKSRMKSQHTCMCVASCVYMYMSKSRTTTPHAACVHAHVRAAWREREVGKENMEEEKKGIERREEGRERGSREGLRGGRLARRKHVVHVCNQLHTDQWYLTSTLLKTLISSPPPPSLTPLPLPPPQGSAAKTSSVEDQKPAEPPGESCREMHE